MKRRLLATISGLVVVGSLAGCLGSDDDSSPAPAASTTISGSAVKGPVSGATVTIRRADTGAVLATTTTNSTGGYSTNVSYTGDVLVEVSGGTYTDEATNASTTLSTPMRVVVTANGSNVTGMVTPLTTMAYTQAFGSTTSGSSVTASAFNTMASNVATQFQLSGVNLATTAPVVSGTTRNAYGDALRGISQYMQNTGTSQATLFNTQMNPTQWGSFSGTFTTAYNGINNTTVTYSFDGSTLTIGGTGVGGGTGTCGIRVSGSVTVPNYGTIPINYNFCYTGLPANSCSSANSSLTQAAASAAGYAGANLNYDISTTCTAGAINVNFTS